jgi:hypothetical protein
MTGLDLTPLSAPFTKLIEVVAAGTGVIYEPTRVVREAKAHAKAEIIRAEAAEKIAEMKQRAAITHGKTELVLAETDEKISEMNERAAKRLYYTEMARQENIERIVDLAADALPPNVSDKPVAQDWSRQFFAGAQDVSDKELRLLWAKILAGEVAEPQSFSKRTLEALRQIDRQEAEWLGAFFSISFYMDGWGCYFDTDATRRLMSQKIGTREWEQHFIDIGLITSEHKVMYASKATGKKIRLGREFFFVMQGPEPDDDRPISSEWLHKCEFTLVGQQLSRIASGPKDISIVQALNDEWRDNGVSIVRIKPPDEAAHLG